MQKYKIEIKLARKIEKICKKQSKYYELLQFSVYFELFYAFNVLFCIFAKTKTNMILIVDSGSTKATWAVCADGTVVATHTTLGINPFYQSESEIFATINPLCAKLPNEIAAVFFYGAGCTPEKKVILADVLQRCFPKAETHVASDLEAAAHALLQRERGIACILGTGSNSCLYNGAQIVENVSPLGFILGDEGSGAVICKKFVGDCLKNQTPPALKTLFLQKYDLTTAEIIEHVYRKPFPNRYLAQFAPFLSEHIGEFAYIHDLVYASFVAFLQRNVLQYADAKRLPIAFVGSVAYHFQDVLCEAMCDFNLNVGTIVQSPIDGLVKYHQ